MSAHRSLRPDRPRAARQSQQGAAAIEFALTLTALIAMLLAIAGFSFLVWAQQVFVRMASEGAQVARLAVQQGDANVASRVTTHLERLAEQAPVVSGLYSSSAYSPTPCAGLSNMQCAEVRVTGDLSAWPLLHLLSGAFAVLDSERDAGYGTLHAKAVIVVPSQ